MSNLRAYRGTSSAQERRTWLKEAEKWSKMAKPAVRSNMHRFEINHGQRYSSYVYSDLPHTLGQRRGGKLGHFKEQGTSSWLSNEGRKAEFGDFGHVVVSYGDISSLTGQRDFKEGYHFLSIYQKSLSASYQQDLASDGREKEARRDENKMHLQHSTHVAPLIQSFLHFPLQWDGIKTFRSLTK